MQRTGDDGYTTLADAPGIVKTISELVGQLREATLAGDALTPITGVTFDLSSCFYQYTPLCGR
jgi:hypothetical protein